MTVINTNTASINAQFNLNKVNQEMEKAMEQLSSGKRINSAADDAAGLAISTRMESQIVHKVLVIHSNQVIIGVDI